jgi:NADH-quinone oxidoreductase subunit L
MFSEDILNWVWLIPAIPFFSFWIILFVGKRLGNKVTQSIGIGALGLCFVLSLLAGIQWIDRAQEAEEGGTIPVEITTNGDQYDCAGVVVRHVEGAHEAETSFGTEEGLPHCSTADLNQVLAAQDGGQVPGGTAVDQAADEQATEGEAAGEAEEEGAAGPVITQWTWFTWGDVDFYVGTQLDGLAMMMLFVVTVVSLLVHIYSTEYLRDDRRFTHYYAFLSLFSASMLFYVLSSSFLQMLIGWELVGLCSFVLIGHWWEDYANARAALKAFFTNRVGDVGLIIGIVILFWAGGARTFSVLGINELAATGAISHTLLLVAALCLFAGVTSKSGQFPLHTWLPDAMAGPTPVSALIHAATMVVAGVYLVARLYPVFYNGLSIGTGTINYVAFIGGFTTVMGGALAFVQRDIKKVLAYSTVSQLGYMIMALGVGAWTAAVFHVFTHAFFKAALFLGAGSVSHACHHSFDMKADMGGLKKYMPQTFWTFAISSAALAGIFPLAGFWSKDEILAGAAAGQGGGAYTFMLVMGLVTALLTAAYMTRCIYLTFFGEYRGHAHPHESPRVITIPLWILSTLAIVVGFINLPEAFSFLPGSALERFKVWVEPTVAFVPVQHADFNYGLAAISLTLALGGFALVYAWYWKNLGPHGITARNQLAAWGYRFLENKYYLDYLYENIIVAGISGPVARGINWFNQNVIDFIVNGVGRGATVVGRVTYERIDQGVIDNVVNGTGVASEEAGQELRRIQTGKVQQYGALLFGGAVVLAAFLVLIV